MYLSSLRADRLQRLLDSSELVGQTPFSITDTEALTQELAETRARGFSTDNQEFLEGMAAIAVAIRDDRGRLLTTLSIHAPIQRLDLGALIEFLPELRDAARRLEEIVLS
jgi:DNA-binding IclR family transcriptional regulator